MMDEWVDVTEEEYKKFIASFPKGLVYDYITIREPPIGSYNDFSDGKEWPESMVAREFLYDEPPSYQIKKKGLVK